MGKKIEWTGESVGNQFWNRLMPLFIQDLTEAVFRDFPSGGFDTQEEAWAQGGAAVPGALGVGVSTYTVNNTAPSGNPYKWGGTGEGGKYKW